MSIPKDTTRYFFTIFENCGNYFSALTNNAELCRTGEYGFEKGEFTGQVRWLKDHELIKLTEQSKRDAVIRKRVPTEDPGEDLPTKNLSG